MTAILFKDPCKAFPCRDSNLACERREDSAYGYCCTCEVNFDPQYDPDVETYACPGKPKKLSINNCCIVINRYTYKRLCFCFEINSHVVDT